MAVVARGDPALPWLGALSLAVIAVPVGFALILSPGPASAETLGWASLAVAALAASLFQVVWWFVVGRRLLREERQEQGVAST